MNPSEIHIDYSDSLEILHKLRTSFVFTYEISPLYWTSVSTSYIIACPFLLFGHAGSSSYRICGVQDVSGPFFSLQQSPNETFFGVLIVTVPFIAALPSLVLIESLKPIFALIAPVLFATMFTIEA